MPSMSFPISTHYSSYFTHFQHPDSLFVILPTSSPSPHPPISSLSSISPPSSSSLYPSSYLSIDEAFVILSLLRAVWALDIPLPFFTYYRSFQYALIAFVSFSAIQWFYLHYNKIPRGGIRDSSLAQNAIILYVIYCVIALFHLFTSPSPSLVVILTVWAVPYAVVLWQTRNKH